MRALLVAGVLVGMALSPSVLIAAPLDGSAPILYAVHAVMDCEAGNCERSTAGEAQLPPFVRVDNPGRQLSWVDGARTSPIAQTQRVGERLMFQGMQSHRVRGAVINEQTGSMWAAAGEDDGAIVISGACIAQ